MTCRLVLRAEGLRGNVLARLGRPAREFPAVRAALDAALLLGELETAAELQQRLADSLEHGGDYDGAAAAYRAAYLYCDTHGADAVGQLCRACATAVLFNRGEWDLAVDVCADVLAEPGTAAQPRAISACLLGLIHALRGAAADARPALAEASSLSARIELVAVELLSGWGLAVLEAQAGAVAAATDRIRQALALVGETQERHYCVPFLQWAATFCATHGLADDARACAAALSRDLRRRRGRPRRSRRSPTCSARPCSPTTRRRRQASCAGRPRCSASLSCRSRRRLRGSARRRPCCARATCPPRETCCSRPRSAAERLGRARCSTTAQAALRELGAAAPARAPRGKPSRGRWPGSPPANST